MPNSSTTELDLLKSLTTSGGATDDLHVIVDSGTITTSTSTTNFDSIVNAQDAVATFTWADVGTANQRVTVIAYTSATVLNGHTATKTFAYTLTGGVYRLDTITKSYS